jgi:hypothetical protein
MGFCGLFDVLKKTHLSDISLDSFISLIYTSVIRLGAKRKEVNLQTHFTNVMVRCF